MDSTPLKLAVFFLALPFGVLSPVLRTGNLGDDISSMKSKSDFSSVLNKETNDTTLVKMTTNYYERERERECVCVCVCV